MYKLSRNIKPIWGWSTSINLYNCDLDIIQNKKMIKQYVVKLCEEIDMKRYGHCHVVKFGTGNKEGYSMFQLIETSNISAHFADSEKKAYIDIFSCKKYCHHDVAAFSKKFFKARHYDYNMIER